MTGPDFHEPLRRKAQPQRRVPRAFLVIGLGLGAAAAIGIVAWRHGDQRGEPFAVGSIARPQPVAPEAPAPPSTAAHPVVGFGSPPEQPEAVASPRQVVDIENGVRVVRPAPGTGPLVFTLPSAAPAAFPEALAEAPDPRLAETGSFGTLPRIGPNGARPDRVYAHPPVAVGGRPAIALLVGGLGLDRPSTDDATRLLPGAVTFGLAPYGDDLAELVRAVRQAGHEVVLQIPMEGVGPAQAGLPHLLTRDGDNAERLRWLMSRVTGYVGIGNALGARFLDDARALEPVLRQAADRGLLFADDGAVTGSLASAIGAGMHVPVARADVVFDASGNSSDIAAAFAKLEALAREQGVAIGSATGRPATVAALARLLADAETRGVVLIPLSQAASRQTSSASAGGVTEPRR